MNCRPIFLLAVLTALAGVLRFVLIGHPPLSDAEAMTILRASGPFSALLDALQRDGLPPLLDLMYWVTARFLPLSPGLLRVVPALAGTLTIPAIYFLARQRFSASVALTAALLATCSTVLLATSRQGTLHAPLIFAATLSSGCLLWWLRTDVRPTWFAWVGSSAAMLGFGTAAVWVLAMQAIIVLLRRRRFIIERRRPGPATASLRFWGAAALQEGRIALLFAIGATVSIAPIAAYAWCYSLARTRLPQFTISDVTGIVFGFRWSPTENTPAAMTLIVAATLALVLMAVVAPILRLRTRSFAMTAIGLLVVVNLAQFAARFVVRADAPLDRIARDLKDASHESGSIAIFVSASRVSRRPALLHFANVSRPVRFHAYDDAQFPEAAPRLKRVFVWDDRASDVDGPNGPTWRLMRDNVYPVYDYGTWSHLATWRRREFVRVGPLPQPDAPPPPGSIAEPPASQPGAI